MDWDYEVKYRVVELLLNSEPRESFLNQHLKGGWRMVNSYAVVDPAIELTAWPGPSRHIRHFVVLEWREALDARESMRPCEVWMGDPPMREHAKAVFHRWGSSWKYSNDLADGRIEETVAIVELQEDTQHQGKRGDVVQVEPRRIRFTD